MPLHEIKEFLILTVYLYITLGAVIVMKTAVLHTEGIQFAFWGVAIVKAAVLAKFMLVGNAMKIGDRYTGALIWPRAQGVGFLLLLVVLTITEEVVVGLFHHRSIAAWPGDIVGSRLRKCSPATSSCCWCSFPILLFGSSARRSGKASWCGCSLSNASR